MKMKENYELAQV